MMRIWGSYLFDVKWALKVKLFGHKRDEFSSYGKNVMNATDGNTTIKMMLMKGEPFCVGRMGTSESQAIKRCLMKRAHLASNIRQIEVQTLHYNAGFFPPHEDAVQKYAETVLDLMPEVDLYSCWNIAMERHFVRNCLKKNALLSHFHCLEPYYHDDPWSAALENKKVLVIHPYANTIEKQYEKRRKLFETKEILPDFELKTLKAVQTITGLSCEFSSWFDALEHMYQRAMSIDFDIAIIGCGAYAFPLACKIKRSGRSAITMCGATQVLFGIKGSGWKNNQVVLNLYNNEWVSPSLEETPAQYKKVEDGCYW
jgi:hypothetical protein